MLAAKGIKFGPLSLMGVITKASIGPHQQFPLPSNNGPIIDLSFGEIRGI
jgi:hypothetical protein